MHHHSTKCQKVVQIHKLLFLTYAKGKKEVRRAGGGSPLTLRPNFKSEKGNVTADKPPVCPAGGVLLIKNVISSGDAFAVQYKWNANSFLFLLLFFFSVKKKRSVTPCEIGCT